MIWTNFSGFALLVASLQILVCYAGPLHNADSTQSNDTQVIGVNRYLKGLLENYRKFMRTGLLEKGIPVLDPLDIQRLLTIDARDKQAFMQVNLTKVIVKGLSGFSVENIDANLNESKISMEVRFPELKVNGRYKMEGRIIEIVPIRGNGTFWLTSKDVTIKATVRIITEPTSVLKNNSYLQLNDDLDLSLDYDKMHMDLEGIEGSTDWTAVVKKILNVTGKDFIKRFIPAVDPLVIPDVNENIDEPTAKLVLRMRRITIHGISTFEIRSLKADLDRGFANVSLHIPMLNASGYCYMNGKVIGIFPLNSDGDFTIDVSDVSIDGHAKLDIASSEGKTKVRMADLKLDLDFGPLNIDFKSLLGGGMWTQMLIKLLTGLGRGLFRHFHEPAMAQLDKLLVKVINKELEKGTLDEIIDKIPMM